MMSWLYYIGHWGVSLFLFLFTHFEINGKANVPKKGALLVSANHLSALDPPVVGVSLGRTTIFMAKEELFRPWFMGYFISRFGAFPVHRGRLDRQALRQAEQTLSKGRALVMFPQGARRGSEGYVPEGFQGAALIAMRSNAFVLPVGITGTEVMRGWRWMLHRPRVTINIGTPFRLTLAEGQTRRSLLEEETRKIMQHITALLPPEYHFIPGESTNESGG